jgi:hypothetical protein
MEDQIGRHKLLRRFWAGALTITTVCAQYATVLMTTPAPTSTPKAVWNDSEVKALLDYLYLHRSASEGAGNFKDTVWSGVVEHVEAFLIRGPKKSIKMCQTKWTAVRYCYLVCFYVN